MIKKAILEKVDHSNGFLIDGYPRQVEQGIEFEKDVSRSLFLTQFHRNILFKLADNY